MQSTQYFKTIFEAAPIGMLLCDQSGLIVDANDHLGEIFGYSPADLIGKPVEILLPESLRAKHPAYRASFTASPVRRNMGSGRDLYGLRQDGTAVPIEVGLCPVSFPDGEYALASIIDISERKQAAEKISQQADALANMNQALLASNVALSRSNEELDEFAYIASHDLKEPLRGIGLLATFIQEDYGAALNDEGRAKLAMMHTLTSRMTSLIDDLLYFSRTGRVELAVEPTPLDDLLDNVLSSLSHWLAEQGIVVRRPQPMPTVICDRVRVSEVFRNLISNAGKYHAAGADRWIEIGWQDAQPPVFFVRDNGIGIDPKHHDRVFKMFKRLHAKDAYGGGSGAGLAFVKRIVERHHGKIWLESAAGQGATFYFTLAPQHEGKRA